MKSLARIYRNYFSKQNKPTVLALLVVIVFFPLSLQAEEPKQGTNSSPKINTAFGEIFSSNSSSVDENSENEETKDGTDTKNKDKNLIIKFVEIPESERPGVKINLTKDYKKTNLADQPEDTYQRSVYKQVDSQLSEPELRANAKDVCSEFPFKKRKNYNIHFLNEKTGRPLANYN